MTIGGLPNISRSRHPFPFLNLTCLVGRDNLLSLSPYWPDHYKKNYFNVKYFSWFRLNQIWNASTQFSEHAIFFLFFFLSEKNHTKSENVRKPITLSNVSIHYSIHPPSSLQPQIPLTLTLMAPPMNGQIEDATNSSSSIMSPWNFIIISSNFSFLHLFSSCLHELLPNQLPSFECWLPQLLRL